MHQLGIETFKLPFDDGFPLSSFYKKVESKREADELRQYLMHCRQECGLRLAERVCDETGKPSKVRTSQL
jgi:actin related protein 2/3 complex subunit 3